MRLERQVLGHQHTVLAIGLVVLTLAGCGDNLLGPTASAGDFLHQAACTDFEAEMLPATADLVIPSIVPAPLGVRIVVASDFDPFMGSSTPVPGGRMAWSVWIYHWDDGDYLGAIGRIPDADTVPRGGVCRWYDPR
jgi:hypothetical protein